MPKILSLEKKNKKHHAPGETLLPSITRLHALLPFNVWENMPETTDGPGPAGVPSL